ncbi:MAG: hypothetical protein AB7O24_01910 [Kofleriaceae bacterium]
MCRDDGLCYESDSEPTCGWEELGPEGGNVEAMFRVNYGGVPFMVAGGAGGMMRSSDDGDHWYRGDYGVPESVISVAMGDDGLMYAGGVSGELYFSSTLGTDWWPMNVEQVTGDAQLTAIASGEVQPGGIAVLYVARGYEVWKLTALGIPDTWSKCGAFPIADAGNTTLVTALAVHPTLHHVVVGTNRTQLFRSKDGCASWEVLYEGVGGGTFSSIAIAAGSGRPGDGVWYAAQRNGMPAIHVWPDTFEPDCAMGCPVATECPFDVSACSGSGQRPTTLCLGSPRSVESILPLDADPRRVIIGTVRTGIRAECYAHGDFFPPPPSPLFGGGSLDSVDALVSADNTLILGYANDGVVRATWDADNGWALTSGAMVPFRGQRILDLAWVGDQLLAATPRGVFARTSGGAWSLITSSAIAQPVPIIVAADPSHAFGAFREIDAVPEAIVRFTRNGEAWTATPIAPSWPASTAPDAMAVASDTLLVMSCGVLHAYRADAWTECAMVHPCNGAAATRMVNVGASVYLATPHGVFVATSMGNVCPVIAPTLSTLPATALAYDSADATLYAAFGDYLATIATSPPYLEQRVSDPPLAGDERIISIAIPRAGELVITTSPRGRAFHSRDRGGAWQELPAYGRWATNVLVADPADSSVIYAGSDGRGVLRVNLDTR